VHVTYDVKSGGRASTAPHLRVPPIKNNGTHCAKLVGAVIRARTQGASEAIQDGDMYVLYDGMKAGTEKNLTDAPFRNVEGAQLVKHSRVLTVMYAEKALRDRLTRNRGSCKHAIKQCEHIHLVTVSAMHPPIKDHLHFDGSNQGEVIGWVKAPDWEKDAECLRVPTGVMKTFFGKVGNIAVGGPNPADGGTKPEFNDGRDPKLLESIDSCLYDYRHVPVRVHRVMPMRSLIRANESPGFIHLCVVSSRDLENTDASKEITAF